MGENKNIIEVKTRARYSLLCARVTKLFIRLDYMYWYTSIYRHVLLTQCIYVFCVDLRTNSDYFPIQN
jgi:hypothetical protein